GLFPYGPD
nr:Chain A, PawL-Derived Peptide PLP-16 [Dahlia pinnata]